MGTLNKMQAIIFLKRLGMLMGLLGGYQEMQLSGKKSFLNMAMSVDGRCFKEDGFPKRKLIS